MQKAELDVAKGFEDFRFDNIAASEDSHFNALLAQADQMGLFIDSFVFTEAGVFQNDEIQALYDTLLAQGSQSLTDARKLSTMTLTPIVADTATASATIATPVRDKPEAMPATAMR